MRCDEDIQLRGDETYRRSPGPFSSRFPFASDDAHGQPRGRNAISPRSNGVDDEENQWVNAIFAQRLPNDKGCTKRVEQDCARPESFNDDGLSRARGFSVNRFFTHGMSV